MYGGKHKGAVGGGKKLKGQKQLKLGDVEQAKGHIDMGTSFGQNPMHQPQRSVFGADNPMSAASLARDKRKALTSSSASAAETDTAQQHNMSDEVFAMLEEDTGGGGRRQERGWSVFPEDEDGAGADGERPSAELDAVSGIYARDSSSLSSQAGSSRHISGMTLSGQSDDPGATERAHL